MLILIVILLGSLSAREFLSHVRSVFCTCPCCPLHLTIVFHGAVLRLGPATVDEPSAKRVHRATGDSGNAGLSRFVHQTKEIRKTTTLWNHLMLRNGDLRGQVSRNVAHANQWTTCGFAREAFSNVGRVGATTKHRKGQVDIQRSNHGCEAILLKR